MPELLTPGVFIQEVEFGPQPIEGVSTSTAGFVGETERGPTNGPPQLVTSFADFQRRFGGFVVGKFLPLAVRGFFENGGKRAYVSRVIDAASAAASGAALNAGYEVALLAPQGIPAAASFTLRVASVVGAKPEFLPSGSWHRDVSGNRAESREQNGYCGGVEGLLPEWLRCDRARDRCRHATDVDGGRGYRFEIRGPGRIERHFRLEPDCVLTVFGARCDEDPAVDSVVNCCDGHRCRHDWPQSRGQEHGAERARQRRRKRIASARFELHGSENAWHPRRWNAGQGLRRPCLQLFGHVELRIDRKHDLCAQIFEHPARAIDQKHARV